MLTVEQFDDLQVGDQIEVGQIFGRLTQEPVVLLASQKRKDGQVMEFVVTYLGVTLGRWCCFRKGGALEWQF